MIMFIISILKDNVLTIYLISIYCCNVLENKYLFIYENVLYLFKYYKWNKRNNIIVKVYSALECIKEMISIFTGNE